MQMSHDYCAVMNKVNITSGASSEASNVVPVPFFFFTATVAGTGKLAA